jgi:hypothetical protein
VADVEIGLMQMYAAVRLLWTSGYGGSVAWAASLAADQGEH